MADINQKENIPNKYNFTKDQEYMSKIMLNYFRYKLQDWKNSILHNENEIKKDFDSLTEKEPDYIDEGVNQELRMTGFSLYYRDVNLLKKIDDALGRIENGTYGYCEETGEPIGVDRLEAWPISRFTIEVQEELEKRK